MDPQREDQEELPNWDVSSFQSRCSKLQQIVMSTHGRVKALLMYLSKLRSRNINILKYLVASSIIYHHVSLYHHICNQKKTSFVFFFGRFLWLCQYVVSFLKFWKLILLVRQHDESVPEIERGCTGELGEMKAEEPRQVQSFRFLGV